MYIYYTQCTVNHLQLKFYVSEIFLYSYEHNSSTPINVLNDLTLIKITVALFVRTGSFLTRYCNCHMKQT